MEFLFNALQLALGHLGALNGSLQLILLYTQLPGQLIKLLLVVGGHLGGGAQVFVVLFNGDLVVHALGLEDLDLLKNLEREMCGLVIVDSQVLITKRIIYLK